MGWSPSGMAGRKAVISGFAEGRTRGESSPDKTGTNMAAQAALFLAFSRLWVQYGQMRVLTHRCPTSGGQVYVHSLRRASKCRLRILASAIYRNGERYNTEASKQEIHLSSRAALKYRLIASSAKFASAALFPIAIARAYGPAVNGDLQLLMAATSYLGLLDSGMSISAINRGQSERDRGATEYAEDALRMQFRSSCRVSVIGAVVAITLLCWSGWAGLIGSSLLLPASLFSAAVILEIAVTPYKYHLYGLGRASNAEKREAFLCVIVTLALLSWSLLIYRGSISLIIGVPIGLLLLRADRAASGIMCLYELQNLAPRGAVRPLIANPRTVAGGATEDIDVRKPERAWISILQALAILNWSTDIFLVRLMVGTAAVSDYSICLRLFMLPASLVGLASPVIQSAVSQGRLSPPLFAHLVQLSWPFILVLALVLALSSSAALLAFPFLPTEIGLSSWPSIHLLISFGLLSALSITGALYAPIANGLGLFKHQVIIGIVFLPLNIFLSWFLAARHGYGVAGIVGATCTTMALTSCFLVPKEILKRLRALAN
jgi:hypothetical protein